MTRSSPQRIVEESDIEKEVRFLGVFEECYINEVHLPVGFRAQIDDQLGAGSYVRLKRFHDERCKRVGEFIGNIASEDLDKLGDTEQEMDVRLGMIEKASGAAAPDIQDLVKRLMLRCLEEEQIETHLAQAQDQAPAPPPAPVAAKPGASPLSGGKGHGGGSRR